MAILPFARRIGHYIADNAIAFVALLVALSGTAYAANTIGSSDIIDDSVLSADIHDSTITRQDMAWAKWKPVLPASGLSMCGSKTGEFCSGADAGQGGATVTWGNRGSGYQEARYRRNATSEVSVQGMVKTNVELGNFQLPVFVLPSGYRPMKTLDFSVPCGGPFGQPTFAMVEVWSSGEVFLLGQDCSTSTWVSLTGVTFPIG